MLVIHEPCPCICSDIHSWPQDKKKAEADQQKELDALFAVAIKQPKVPAGTHPTTCLATVCDKDGCSDTGQHNWTWLIKFDLQTSQPCSSSQHYRL